MASGILFICGMLIEQSLLPVFVFVGIAGSGGVPTLWNCETSGKEGDPVETGDPKQQ